MMKEDHFNQKGKYGLVSSKTLRAREWFGFPHEKEIWRQPKKNGVVYVDTKVHYRRGGYDIITLSNGESFKSTEGRTHMSCIALKSEQAKNRVILASQLPHLVNSSDSGKKVSKKAQKRRLQQIDSAKRVLEIREALSGDNVINLDIPLTGTEHHREHNGRFSMKKWWKNKDSGREKRKKTPKNLEKLIEAQLFNVQ